MTVDGEAAKDHPRKDHPSRADGVSPAARLRVVLAEDDVLLREGLASVLERHGLEVVGQAAGASQLLGLIRQE